MRQSLEEKEVVTMDKDAMRERFAETDRLLARTDECLVRIARQSIATGEQLLRLPGGDREGIRANLDRLRRQYPT